MREFITEKEWKNGEFNCKIIFTQLGHRCGYVGVPKQNKEKLNIYLKSCIRY